MKTEVNGFIRELVFYPAYSKIAEGYGRGCAEIAFYLIKDNQAVQFKLMTQWFPEDERRTLKQQGYYPYLYGTDLGYHSPTPLYEGQSPMNEGKECHIIKCSCYYDGSSLNAEPVFELLVNEGEEAVWKYLEKYFDDMFLF